MQKWALFYLACVVLMPHLKLEFQLCAMLISIWKYLSQITQKYGKYGSVLLSLTSLRIQTNIWPQAKVPKLAIG